MCVARSGIAAVANDVVALAGRRRRREHVCENLVPVGEVQGAHVFVSYAWDDQAHVSLVRRFVEFLRGRCGVRVELDFDAAGKPQVWPRWMEEQIRNADFILVVASPEYKRRAEEDQTLAQGEGRGVRWETRLILELSYADPADGLARVLPIVLPGRSVDEIPFYLGPTSRTHYVVSDFSLSGAELLVRYLTGETEPTSPGPLPALPAWSNAESRSAATPAPAGPRILVDADEFLAGMGRLVPGGGEPVVGRDDVLGQVVAFAGDGPVSASRVLVVEGRGGIGKTRVAVEGARRAGTTLVAGTAVSLNADAMAGLPVGEPVVLVVDDAHRCPDLSGLAALAADPRYDQVKLVLTVRPGLAETVLMNAGLDRLRTARVELRALDRADIEAIVVGRGFDNPVFALAVVDLAEGVPLIAHAACDLAATGGTFSWHDAADIIEDHVVARLLAAGGYELRAAAVALAALSTAERGEDLAPLCGAVTGLPSDEARLDVLLADLADAGLADTASRTGGALVYTLRPHLAAPVLIARALGPARVRIDLARLLPVLGQAALHIADGGPPPETAGLLGIGKLVPATAAGPWLASPPLATQLDVLAQAALRAGDASAATMIGRAVLELLPDGADVDTWREVLLLAQQVVPAAPWLFDQLHKQMVRQGPPPPPPPVWGDMPGGGYGEDMKRLLQQTGNLASRAAATDCAAAVRLLLTTARLAAPWLNTRDLNNALRAVEVLAGQPADPSALLNRRAALVAAITTWTADQRRTGQPTPIGDRADAISTARTALAALRPFLTFVVERATRGTSAAADVLVLTAHVLPDAGTARDTLTAAAAAAAGLLDDLEPVDAPAKELLRALVRLPAELRGTAARGLPAGGGQLPDYARTALRSAAAALQDAVAARWDELPVWARHAAATASTRRGRDTSNAEERAVDSDTIADRAAVDAELQRMLVLLPIEPDLDVYLQAGPEWEQRVSRRVEEATAVATELGWRASLDLLQTSAEVAEDVTGDNPRWTFAEQTGRTVPVTDIGLLLDKLVSAASVPAEQAVLRGIVSAHPDEMIDAMPQLCATPRGASLALTIVWDLPQEHGETVLDRVHNMITDPGPDPMPLN